MSTWKHTVWQRLSFIGALACLTVTTVDAQPILTSVTTMSLDASGTPNGRFTETSGFGTCCSNTYITRGTDPTTDAFLFNGNAAGTLIPSGIALTTGINTFHLWGFTGMIGSPNFAVALFTGDITAASAPTVSSYWTPTTNTISGAGVQVRNDFATLVNGVGLSAILGDYQLTIAEWSPLQVTRNVTIGPAAWADVGQPIENQVGRLVLDVKDLRTPPTEPPVTNVPEPSGYLLLATGLVVLGAVSRRKHAPTPRPH